MKISLVPSAVVSLATLVLCVVLARLGFPFELFSHFTPQLALAALLITVLTASTGKRWWTITSAGLAVILCWRAMMVPAPTPLHEDHGQSGAETITLASFNMWGSERAAYEFAAYAESEGVDVIAITEVYNLDQTEFLQQFSAWPHFISVQHSRTLGAEQNRTLYLLSNRPLDVKTEASERVSLGREPLHAEIDTVAGHMTIFAVHPYPPYSRHALADRNETFTYINRHTPSHGRYAVMGDLNITPWSPDFRLLPGRRAGDARLAPTWLTSKPLLGLPLDHIMLGDGVELQFATTGGAGHSDHLPVLARVLVAPEFSQDETESD